MDFFEEINGLRWIALVNINEVKSVLDIRIIGAVDLSSDVLATAYHIHFSSYIAYTVIDESYISENDDSTKLFNVLTQSAYLDFLHTDTAVSGFIAELKQYTLHCLNHIIHVAAFEEPVIVRVD